MSTGVKGLIWDVLKRTSTTLKRHSAVPDTITSRTIATVHKEAVICNDASSEDNGQSEESEQSESDEQISGPDTSHILSDIFGEDSESSKND